MYAALGMGMHGEKPTSINKDDLFKPLQTYGKEYGFDIFMQSQRIQTIANTWEGVFAVIPHQNLFFWLLFVSLLRQSCTFSTPPYEVSTMAHYPLFFVAVPQ